MHIFTVSPKVNLILSYFKQLPSNFTLVLGPIQFNKGGRLLSDVAEGLILLSDNPLHCHAEIWWPLPIFLKYMYVDWKTK